MHIHVFESLQLEDSYVGDLLYKWHSSDRRNNYKICTETQKTRIVKTIMRKNISNWRHHELTNYRDIQKYLGKLESKID